MRIAFDVDGTLIQKSAEGLDVPRYEVIRLLESFLSFGHEIYVWSGSGQDYAETWCKKLGIFPIVKQVIHKNITTSNYHDIDLTVDDKERTALARLNLKV